MNRGCSGQCSFSWQRIAGRLIDAPPRRLAFEFIGAIDSKPVLRHRVAIAARIWKTVPELDAWITNESWYHTLKEEIDLVQLPDKERALRITPIAMMTTSRDKGLARAFVDFLKSEDAHKVFQQWGWK